MKLVVGAVFLVLGMSSVFLVIATPITSTTATTTTTTSTRVLNLPSLVRPGLPPKLKNHRANPGPGCSVSTSCPIGVTDWGITPSGSTYSYNAEGAISFVTFNRLYLDGCSESSTSGCGMSNQLNAINENVLECATSASSSCLLGDYWPQDVAEISQTGATTFSIYMLDNIWNFTAPGAGMPAPLILTGSPCNGENYGTARYACSTSSFSVTLPFYVEMWMYSYVNPSHNAEVDFYAWVQSNGATVFGPTRWDNVTFNSLDLASTSGCPNACFNVGGTNGAYGSETDSISNVVVACCGGATLDVPAIQVYMSTGYLPTTTSGYYLVPHAWSSGFTGETTLNVMMSNAFDSTNEFGETGAASNIALY